MTVAATQDTQDTVLDVAQVAEVLADPFAEFRAQLAAMRIHCPNTGTDQCNDGTGCSAC